MRPGSFWTKKQFSVDISGDCTRELERQINNTSTAANAHNPEGYKPLLYRTVDSDFLLTTWTSKPELLWALVTGKKTVGEDARVQRCQIKHSRLLYLRCLVEKHGILTFVYWASAFPFFSLIQALKQRCYLTWRGHSGWQQGKTTEEAPWGGWKCKKKRTKNTMQHYKLLSRSGKFYKQSRSLLASTAHSGWFFFAQTGIVEENSATITHRKFKCSFFIPNLSF